MLFLHGITCLGEATNDLFINDLESFLLDPSTGLLISFFLLTPTWVGLEGFDFDPPKEHRSLLHDSFHALVAIDEDVLTSFLVEVEGFAAPEEHRTRLQDKLDFIVLFPSEMSLTWLFELHALELVDEP